MTRCVSRLALVFALATGCGAGCGPGRLRRLPPIRTSATRSSRSTRRTRRKSRNTRPLRTSRRRWSTTCPRRRPFRRRWRCFKDVAGAPGVLPYSHRGLPVHADGREGQSAREGLFDRQDGGRSRDDRGGGLVRGEPRQARREPREPREARRSTDDQAGRCGGGSVGGGDHADLLHHGNDSFAGDRRPDGVDGARRIALPSTRVRTSRKSATRSLR